MCECHTFDLRRADAQGCGDYRWPVQVQHDRLGFRVLAQARADPDSLRVADLL